SLRRMKETIGDIDFLITVKGSKKSALAKASANKIMDFFVSLPDIVKLWGKGPTKSSVRMRQGFDVDIRVIPAESTSLGFGAGIAGAIGGFMVALYGFNIIFILVGFFTIVSALLLLLIHEEIVSKNHIFPKLPYSF
ncbi:unnamed protein product, partial [marine sediment metagenome]